MAMAGIKDQSERKVEVNRQQLLETLLANRTKHVAAYKEALAGYKAQAEEKFREAYEAAKTKLEKNLQRGLAAIAEFDELNFKGFGDHIALVEGISVHLPVPRCYEKEYDAAIDMAQWDVRDTLELTHAEFQCFVRDVWEWSRDFQVLNMTYSGLKKI